MRFLKLFFLALLLPFALVSTGASAEQIPVPKMGLRVTDLTQTLSTVQIEALAQKLKDLEKTKGSQIAVLILPSTGEESIAQFGFRVADEWKVGRKGVGDGVILLIAKNDKKVHIEVGRGLEGAIPDIVAARIIREFIRPYLQQNDFVGGINAGIDKISAAIAGEPLPAPPSKNIHSNNGERHSGASQTPSPHIFIWFAIIVVGVIVYRKAGPWLARSGVGIGGALAAGFAGTPILIALAIGLGMSILVSILASRVFWEDRKS
ncbi:MAG: YgcG family protein, partial [Undibacterium sp.]|nr:YgcG family protein [Undibacterium sp.]